MKHQNTKDLINHNLLDIAPKNRFFAVNNKYYR